MKANSSAVVFPGQGTQRIGMGKDFYDNISASQAVFEEASDALDWDVAAMCFMENNKIDLTEYAQPCIMTTEIAMFRGIQEKYSFSPEYFGGHSLGEYTALVAAGVISLYETVQVVQERGRLMQAISPEGFGGMAAVIGKNVDFNRLARSIETLRVDIANINSSDQIVISGKKDTLAIAEQKIKESLGPDPTHRYVQLNVSAPFHSSLMQPMQSEFKHFMVQTLADKIHPNSADRVVSNFTGGFYLKDKEAIVDTLISQISAPVQWSKNMETLADRVEDVYEVGPNRPLRGFFSTIGVNCKSITNLSAAKRQFGKNAVEVN
jgi:[acyl-carrier-protein] S-malonyltransferase